MWRDVLSGVRAHARTPIVTAVIISTLTLGIAASSISFWLVNALFLRPPPIAHPERFVRVYHQTGSGTQFLPVSYPEFDAIRGLRDTFDDASLEEPLPLNLGRSGSGTLVFGERVAPGYFTTLGVLAARGRLFSTLEQASGEPVAVLSHALWQRQFGGRDDVLNQPLRLDGQLFRVIGIARPGFGGTILGFSSDLWIPFASSSRGRSEQYERAYRGEFVMARLAPGVTATQARSVVDLLSRRLDRDHPDSNRGIRLVAMPESEGRVFPTFRNQVLGASVLVVLIALLLTAIACTNVAGVLLVRGDARGAEIGVRLALGASRGRIVAQLLTEAAVLSLVAGVIGIAVAERTSRLISSTRVALARGAAAGLDAAFDWRVVAFSLVMIALTTLLFGLVPALDASRQDLLLVMKKGGRRWVRSPARDLFLCGQITVSMLLLAAGGLFVRSLQHGRAADLGFDASHVVTTAIDVRGDGRSTAQRAAFWTRVLDDVRRLPSIESASLTYRAPLELGVVMRGVGPAGFVPGPGQPWPATEYAAIDTAYFHTLRIPFVEGRDFSDREIASGAPVAILNDVLARRLWPGAAAIGKQVVSPDGETLDVVGVVRHSKYTTIGEAPQPYLYVTRHGGNQALTLVAKAVGDPAAHLHAIAQIVSRLEPRASLYDVGTMSSRVNKSLAPTTGAASSLGLIGLMALGLTALGLFGSVAHTVSRRTYEIGVRRALGASNGRVLWLIARDTVRTVSTGIACGTITAIASAYAIRGLLYDVSPADPLAFVGAPLLLAGVCLAALALPLQRAIGIEAARALRYE